MIAPATSGVSSATCAHTAGVEYHPPPKASTDQQVPQISGEPQLGAGRAEATPPKASALRLVGCRVDALAVAFRVDPSPWVEQLLASRALLASTTGAVDLCVGPHAFELKHSRRTGFHPFANADVRCTYDVAAIGGWRLEIVLRATYLATHTLEASLALGMSVANSFGTVAECPRLRRFDCAADFVGFDLCSDDARLFATKRAKVDEFQAEAKDVDEIETGQLKPALRVHRGAKLEVEGFSISLGNPISARIYDKTAELLVPGREEKRTIEHERWRSCGWDGSSRVTRVEFQHRGDFLDEADLRNATDLPSKLDAVWQHDVRWLRMVLPDSNPRPSRRTLDPRWAAVQEVMFTHRAAPIARVRRRGGATIAHVVGATLSRLASTGRIHTIKIPETEDGEVLDERGFADRMTVAEAEDQTRAHLDYVFAEAAKDCAEQYGSRYGWNDAACRLHARHNAAVARFSSADDRDGVSR